jgi:hypothetical protein
MTIRPSARHLLAILLGLSLTGCGDIQRYLKSGEVGWALKRALRDQHAERIELVQLTRFTWDELFLFGPYEPANEVCRTLGSASSDCESSLTLASSDGEVLMVFRRGGKIVHSEIHLRWHGDFSPMPNAPLTPQTAVFSVSIQGKNAAGEDRLVLSPLATQGEPRMSAPAGTRGRRILP